MPNKKKKYSARFPPARIKKIMQKDDEVGKVAAAVPVIISRSLELFVESLIKKTNNLVVSRNARTLTPQHIKQTVLVESEFKFLHELVSTIPDVQCTEDEQPSSHLPHQPPLHEVSLSRPATDHGTLATAANNTSSTTVAKPGGKQRGRPRKIKTEDMKQSRPKKPRLASTVEECDSEETCSGSEEENKETNDQSKQVEKASSSIKVALPPCPNMPATLSNTILFNTPLLTGPNNHILSDIFPTISMELPKLPDAYMTLNGATTSSTLASQQLGTAHHTPSNEEALDLSTSGGKNGDLKVKKDMAASESVVGHQNLFQNKTVPRTFYMTNILNANVQTMSGPGLLDASMNQPQQHIEAYKLNIPKISVQKPGQPLIRPDVMSPSALAQGSRPSLSQPLQNFDHQARPVGSPPAVTYQIQNLAQKGHQIIFSQMRPEMAQNITTDAQLFNANSPVRLLQYPRFVSLVPGAQFGGIKSPNSSSSSGPKADPPSEDSKLNPQPEKCTTKDSANESQS